MRLLIWSAVINGVVAVPIMIVMMLIAGNEQAMGRYRARGSLVWAGWLAVVLMTFVVAALIWSAGFG
jgi:Mn2+/Fe2+ NRAMP family transporter